MVKVSRSIGIVLVTVSLIAFIQTIREIALFEVGRSRYVEQTLGGPVLSFAGHVLTVRDDQPQRAGNSQASHEGMIQPLLDGVPLGPPSRARVRPALSNFGRYHLWTHAWLFTTREEGEATLWWTRRLQPTDDTRPRFEVTTISADGKVDTRLLSAWQLGSDYRRYRSTQFIRHGTWAAMPLALGGLPFPILLLVFPIGTLIIGVLLPRVDPGATRVGLRAN